MTTKQLIIKYPTMKKLISKNILLNTCKILGIKGVSKYKKEEIIYIISVVKMQRLFRKKLSNNYKSKKSKIYELFGTDSEDDELEQINISELDKEENYLVDFINDNKYTAVLLYLSNCKYCENFKLEFDKIKNYNIKFAIFNIDKYQEKFGTIEGNTITYYPSLQLCKRGEVFKTLESPKISVINKQINCMVNCIGQRALSDECKYRGLKSSGKNDELKKIIEEDDKLCDRINFCIHEKTKDELIEYIEFTLKKKSKKHIEMTNIELMKKIRKIINNPK